jgi:hypothetical protein
VLPASGQVPVVATTNGTAAGPRSTWRVAATGTHRASWPRRSEPLAGHGAAPSFSAGDDSDAGAALALLFRIQEALSGAGPEHFRFHRMIRTCGADSTRYAGPHKHNRAIDFAPANACRCSAGVGGEGMVVLATCPRGPVHDSPVPTKQFAVKVSGDQSELVVVGRTISVWSSRSKSFTASPLCRSL